MQKKLITICADDFGLHEGINAACIELATRKRISAISAMVGAPAWRDGAKLLGAFNVTQVDIGLHLDFTEYPIAANSRRSHAALVAFAYARQLDRALVKSEIDAQLNAFEHALGRAPAYIDGHQHVHQLPVIRDALIAALSTRYAYAKPWLRDTRASAGVNGVKPKLIETLGARALRKLATKNDFPQNNSMLGVYDFQATADHFQALLTHWLTAAQSRDLLMCHPSQSIKANGLHGSMNRTDAILSARIAEYEFMQSEAFSDMLAEHRVDIVTMSSLCRSA